MSDLAKREDVIEYKKYEQLNNFLRVLKGDVNHPQRKLFFEALADGHGCRLGGFDFSWSELVDTFFLGSLREVDDCADNIIVNLITEENLDDDEWNGDIVPLSEA